MSEDNWFKIGKEGFEERKRVDALTKARKEKGIPRFRLAEGEEAVIIFVDSEPFFVYEHNIWQDNMNNYVTCVREYKDCAVCEKDSDKRPTLTGYFTIIDTREFTRKDGTKTKNRRILFPAKGKEVLAKLEAIITKNQGNIKGLSFNVKRYSSQSANCGSDFELLNDGKRVNLTDSFGAEFNKAYDYKTVLRPSTPEELASLGYKSGTVFGSDDDLGDVASSQEEDTDLSSLL